MNVPKKIKFSFFQTIYDKSLKFKKLQERNLQTRPKQIFLLYLCESNLQET